MQRRNIPGNSPWEPLVGYSRAVRAGPHVWVSGTTATDATGTVAGPGDVAAQARQAFENVRRALAAAGVGLEHVVRTRMYVTRIDDWQAVAAVHAEYFGTVRPAATMVEVRRLISPEMLVEVEAEAYVGG